MNGNGVRYRQIRGPIRLSHLQALLAQVRWHTCPLCGERFKGLNLPLHHRLRHTRDFLRRMRQRRDGGR